MKQKIRALFDRVSDFFFPPPDPDLVTIQNVLGNLEEVKVEVLFLPMRQLIEDGTQERVELLHVLTAVFANNENMVVGEVIQETPFDLENQGVTSAQIKVLGEILSKKGLALCTEICRPTWKDLMDQVTAVKSDKWDYRDSLK